MNVQIETIAPEQVSAHAVAFICFETEQREGKPVHSDQDPDLARQSGWLPELRDSGEFSGKFGEAVVLYRPNGLSASRLVVAGGGKQERFSPVEARRVAGFLVRFLKPKGVRSIALVLQDAEYDHVRAAIEGAIVANWEPDKYKTDPKKHEKQIDTFTIVVPGAAKSRLAGALERARVVAEAQNAARDLVNEPANRLHPQELAAAARAVADGGGLHCEVLDEAAMRELGMGALLGVAQGSKNAPCLIVLKYTPSSIRSDVHVALVGKGVTFDTGGISIKPADGMEKMRYDMAGGAAAIAAMQAIAQLKPKISVTAYIPAVENMLGGDAQRPGDIVTTLSGKTVEVLNTDAEGRLILADAITYATRHGATHIVDAATLTGAVGVALGHYNIGAFTNDQPLLDRLLAAAKAAGEKTWQLPLEEDYKEYLKSAFADLPNVGGRPAGSITAAWFLKEFADPTPWVHLDIAATAWHDDPKPWMSKGPTGVAVRTFVELAMNWV